MHGYGVACFTAKCRRRTTAPAPTARLLHTRLVSSPNLPLPSLSTPSIYLPTYSLSSFLSTGVRRSLSLLSSSSRALLRHPRRGFLSSVSLCLPFPRRAVASCRVAYTLLAPCMHISIPHTRPLSHTVRFPRCMPRCISLPWRALFGRVRSRPRRQNPSDYNVCVFHEPRRTTLASANARADFRVALIALGGRVRHAWIF